MESLSLFRAGLAQPLPDLRHDHGGDAMSSSGAGTASTQQPRPADPAPGHIDHILLKYLLTLLFLMYSYNSHCTKTKTVEYL